MQDEPYKTMRVAHSQSKYPSGCWSLLAIMPQEQGKVPLIWDLTSNQEADLLKGKLDGVTAIGFSLDGSLAATGSNQGVVILYETTTDQEVRSMNLNDTAGEVTGGQPVGIGGLTFSPDSKTLAGAADFGMGILVLWNIADGSVQHTATAMNHVAGPVATPLLAPGDWSKVYWWSRGSIIGVDIASDQETLHLSHEDFVQGIAFSPDGRILVTSAGGTVNGQFVPLVKLWDVVSGQELHTLTDFPAIPMSIVFSPDGMQLAIAVAGQGVTLWGTVENQ